MTILFLLLLAYWLACGVYTMRHGREMGFVERMATGWVILPIMLAWTMVCEGVAWCVRQVEGLG